MMLVFKPPQPKACARIINPQLNPTLTMINRLRFVFGFFISILVFGIGIYLLWAILGKYVYPSVVVGQTILWGVVNILVMLTVFIFLLSWLYPKRGSDIFEGMFLGACITAGFVILYLILIGLGPIILYIL